MVTNNQMAIGTLRAIRDAGLRIPDDVAVVSFDDFEGADLLSPGLTAVTQDVPALAAAAVNLLLRRVNDDRRAPRSVIVPTALQHRGSCGCGRERSAGGRKP